MQGIVGAHINQLISQDSNQESHLSGEPARW